MKFFILYSLFFILYSFKGNAQVASLYTFATSAGTYTAITGGTQSHGATFDDAIVSATIPSFNFNGTNYTTINISSNGFITFGATAPGSTLHTPISGTTAYSGAISAFGADLNYAAAGSPEVRYETVGNEFIVQWQDARRYNIASERISFQIRLNTTTNEINIVYGGTITPGSDATYLQVGLRGTANTDYNNRSITASAWSSSSAGGANTSTCYYNSAQTSYVPATGRTFTWTRSTCTPPTTQATTFTQSAAGSTTATVGWTRGNGNNVIVVASASAITADPTSGTTYTANAAYASGTALGGGYVVYSGSGTSVSLTALTGNTTYYFSVFEYNTTGTCYNQAQLSGTASTSNPNTSLTIGTGTTASLGTFYGPFNNYYENNKTQILYKRSEMGSVAYTITHLALDIKFVTVDVTKRDFDNFTIKLMHSSTTSFSTAYETTTGATTVFTSADYAMPTSTGWSTFDITDFAYNGTDNLLVEIVWGDNAEYCGASDYYTINHTDYTSTGNYLVTFGYADAVTPPAYSGRSYLRPNIKFTMSSCAVVAGMSASSASSVSTCSTTTSLTLSGQDVGTTLQWQWSPDNTNWYNLSSLTTSSETSPYISRSTEYFRTAVKNSCVSLSTAVVVTSSAASSCNFWEGTVSTSAIAAANWSLASVPASTTTDLLILKGTAYTCTFPTGTDNLDGNNYYIQENATLDNLDDNLTGAIWISGNLVCNGTISYSTTGQSYVVMLGTTKTITAGGSANLSGCRLQIGLTGYTASTTLASNIAIHECLVYTSGTLNVSTFILQCKYFGNNTSTSTFNLNSGTLEVGGGTAFDKSGAHLTGKTNPYFELGTVSFGTGTVYYNAGEDYSAVDQTVKSKTYYNLKVRTNNGYTATVGSGAGLIVSNSFETTNPSTAGGVATLANAADFNGSIINGASAVLNGGALSHTLAGNWTNSGTYNCSTGTITLDGGSAQTINGSSTTSFYNLAVANTTGGVSLTVNSTVTNTLTLTSGKLTVQGYTLAIGTGSANGSISGGSSTAYIVAYDNSGTIGYVKRFVNSNAAYSYPIGDASNYVPLTFTLTSATLSSAYLTAFTKATKVTGLNASITTNYIARHWNLTESGFTSPTYDISYTYVDGDIVGSETGMLPVKKSGSTWYRPTGSSFTDGTVQGTGSFTAGTNLLSWTGLTTFSLFGGVVSAAVALPIELVSFTGKKDGNNNELKWTTATELNNDYFTIEKTLDGTNFEIVGIENGAGNSNQYLDYSLIDYDVREVINYYRLKQTDFDGKYDFSELISIDNRTNNKEIAFITNILGQEVNENYRGLVVIVYSDGTSVKVIQ